ncbi:MAG: YIP1 family protein [Chloroflexota bacterium]|nr:YIP1 family protein [Chloroflexota bacterium]
MKNQDQLPSESTAEARLEAPAPNLLWSIIVQPVRALTYIRDNPRRSRLAPIMIAILLAIAQALVTVPIADQGAEADLLRAGIALVSGLMGLGVRLAFRMGMIHLLGLGLGGRNRFDQVFSVVAWTWVPLLIRSLLRTLVIAFSGALPTHQGLVAYLAALGQPLPTGIHHALLSQIQLDIFTLWNLMLLALGVLVITELPKTKALLMTAGYWALATGLSLISTLAGRFLLPHLPMLGGGG